MTFPSSAWRPNGRRGLGVSHERQSWGEERGCMPAPGGVKLRARPCATIATGGAALRSRGMRARALSPRGLAGAAEPRPLARRRLRTPVSIVGGPPLAATAPTPSFHARDVADVSVAILGRRALSSAWASTAPACALRRPGSGDTAGGRHDRSGAVRPSPGAHSSPCLADTASSPYSTRPARSPGGRARPSRLRRDVLCRDPQRVCLRG